MKIIGYGLYGLWVTACIVLKILGLVSWWVATSWLWFPIAGAVCFLVIINLVVFAGQKLQERRDSKIPDGCEVCIWGQLREGNPDGKCLGQLLAQKHKYGTLCPSYKRHIKH